MDTPTRLAEALLTSLAVPLEQYLFQPRRLPVITPETLCALPRPQLPAALLSLEPPRRLGAWTTLSGEPRRLQELPLTLALAVPLSRHDSARRLDQLTQALTDRLHDVLDAAARDPAIRDLRPAAPPIRALEPLQLAIVLPVLANWTR